MRDRTLNDNDIAHDSRDKVLETRARKGKYNSVEFQGVTRSSQTNQVIGKVISGAPLRLCPCLLSFCSMVESGDSPLRPFMPTSKDNISHSKRYGGEWKKMCKLWKPLEIIEIIE